jgi:hypothetical protein
MLFETTFFPASARLQVRENLRGDQRQRACVVLIEA